MVFNRRSMRLKGHDYSSPGGYFVTICTYERKCLFGCIVEERMELNNAAKVAESCLLEISEHFTHAIMDSYIVMPNHLHAIIIITGLRHPAGKREYEKFAKPVCCSIPTIIRSYKSAVTKKLNELSITPATPIWQRNYYEHILRNDNDLKRIREYIINNPAQWGKDEYFTH